jgi:hypothetical protein
MTATGVRSSCETAATNSICCLASVCARRADTTMSPMAVLSSSRMPELSIKLRLRTLATAASSEPARWVAATRQRPSNRPRLRPRSGTGRPSLVARPSLPPRRRSCSIETTMRSPDPGGGGSRTLAVPPPFLVIMKI